VSGYLLAPVRQRRNPQVQPFEAFGEIGTQEPPGDELGGGRPGSDDPARRDSRLVVGPASLDPTTIAALESLAQAALLCLAQFLEVLDQPTPGRREALEATVSRVVAILR
jgi:hypothetical protein